MTLQDFPVQQPANPSPASIRTTAGLDGGLRLRRYQVTIENDVRAAMAAGRRAVVVVSPTGSGKTATTVSILAKAAAKGKRSLFVVHRRELVKQSCAAFAAQGIHHGVIAAGFQYDPLPLVHVAAIQTLARRLDRVARPDLIVWDEFHHAVASTWLAVRRRFQSAYHLGLTATPERLDGQGLSDVCEAMVLGPSCHDLIEQGYLSRYRLYLPPGGVDVSRVHTRAGDYAKDELADAADRPTITGSAVIHYQRHAAGKRAICSCVSIQHSKHVAAQFVAAGIPAEHVDGETPALDRDAAMERFRAGSTLVLCNVDLFGEGVDVPAVEVAILLRPTQSTSLYLQAIGRVLRPMPGKTAIILDHAGNAMRHGLPDDEREWTLEGHKRKARDGEPAVAVRVCPACYACQSVTATVCGFCGAAFDIKARKVAETAGDLEEADLDALRKARRMEEGSCRTYQELVALGTKRGYQYPVAWAQYRIRARNAREMAK